MTYRKYIVFTTLFMMICAFSIGQSGLIHGTISVDAQLQAFANVSVSTNPMKGTQSDDNGYFQLGKIPFGEYTLTISYLGFEDKQQTIVLSKLNPSVEVNFNLTETSYALNDVVVTGTKTFKRKTNSAVIVNVLSSKTLDNVQACNLSDGLKFQPGLRVETDCQTCNYTQLRMNGLAGGY